MLGAKLREHLKKTGFSKVEFVVDPGLEDEEGEPEGEADAQPQAAEEKGKADRHAKCDPALFSLLAGQVGTKTWNDEGVPSVGRKRGLGPRVCHALWTSGGYDQICELIEKHGVDTGLAGEIGAHIASIARGGDRGRTPCPDPADSARLGSSHGLRGATCDERSRSCDGCRPS
jgi:hypothetical protein